MRFSLRFSLIAAVLLAAALSPAVHAQAPPPELHARLSLADNKSSFRIGEEIKLVIEFTADKEGYWADTIPDGWQQTADEVSVSPASGVTRWLDEFMGGQMIGRDVRTAQKLSNTPTCTELVLNDSIRFDRPGKYSIQITTRRVNPAQSGTDYVPPIALTTNQINFEVQPMSDADEEKIVKKLSDQLDAARGWQAEEKLTQELSFLTGDVSTREKVRRFLNSDGRSGNYGQHVMFGLYIARDRDLVLRLLEKAIRDPQTPVSYSLLTAVTKLRVLRDYGAVDFRHARGVLLPQTGRRTLEVERGYLAELVAGLSKRTGKSQTAAAKTILMRLPKDLEASDPVLVEVRRILVQQFDSLALFDQEYLLSMYWEKLRDPALITSLQNMLTYSGVASKNVHDTALRCLMEIAPDKSKEYVLAEIRDPTSLVDFDILKNLPDDSLPEVDATLLEQIRRFASSKERFNQTFLQAKTALAVRYASENIYPALMSIYNDAGDKLPLQSRAVLLAYLVKHNEAEALPLIERAIAETKSGEDVTFLPELTKYHYSDAIDALLRKRLESNDPHTAGTAAYLISLHGPAEDQKIIEARLERWKKDWGGRPAEAETNLQFTVERELIMALTHAKSWKLSEGRYKELRQSCVTKGCKETFGSQ
jgi:hypothetical protein